jgi:aryl-alcohol dehydrogenase-like predicted oxidoreductase
MDGFPAAKARVQTRAWAARRSGLVLLGLAAFAEMKRALADSGSKDPAYGDATLAQFALRWTLMFDAVTCAIPGARTPEQARANAAASDLPPLPPDVMRTIEEIYGRSIRDHVHRVW